MDDSKIEYNKAVLRNWKNTHNDWTRNVLGTVDKNSVAWGGDLGTRVVDIQTEYFGHGVCLIFGTGGDSDWRGNEIDLLVENGVVTY